MTRVERLTALVLILQEGRRNADVLSEQFCVSRRTVIRDVQALTAMGVPVDSHGGPGGGYEIARGSTLAPLHLTWREALLLMMAMEGLAKMADTPFAADRASLAAKLRALLPESQQARVAGLLERVGIEVPNRPQRAPHLDALMGRLGQWVCVDYDGRETTVRIDRVYADGGFWYLEGADANRSRTLRVDRIRTVREAEAPDVVVEPLPYDHPSHPTIRVRLTAAGARRVEREPHLGPHAREGLLEFRCPPSELDWYARYFGGMGTDAHVEAPAELVERIVGRAYGVLGQYGHTVVRPLGHSEGWPFPNNQTTERPDDRDRQLSPTPRYASGAMSLKLDLVGIVAKDIAASLRFYELLGLPMPEAGEEDHVECTLPNGLRIAWDSLELMKQIDAHWVEPVGHRLGLAFLAESPAEVDATYAKIVAAGYEGHKEPWDAFWGQRYAQVKDPDGNVVDLFAPL